ncbi:MAG: exo-alpha-sialidase [Phycisphaerae bacterium]|nr:exo-alpha-sialidase [Phycisphaerae bacterium]
MFQVRILTESWNRVVAVPYIVYMPERDRILMLVSVDYPHRPMVLWSDDRGRSWSPPRFVYQDFGDDSDRGHHVGVSLTYLGGGNVVFSVESKGRYFSEDFGETWSEPVARPPTSDGRHWYQWDSYLVDKIPAAGRTVRVAETGYNYIGDTKTTQAEIRFSEDLCRTWSAPVRVPQWKGVNEVALVRAANGDMVAACRTDKPAHIEDTLDHYEGLGVSISSDDGHTWSPVNMLYDYGRHHPSLVRLGDGRIVMTYVVRKGYPDTADGFPQFGIEAVISRDHGRTWNLDDKIVLAEWAGNRQGPNAWWASSQATSTILLPDGRLLTAFGTGYRSQPNENNMAAPRDVGLVEWQVPS